MANDDAGPALAPRLLGILAIVLLAVAVFISDPVIRWPAAALALLALGGRLVVLARTRPQAASPRRTRSRGDGDGADGGDGGGGGGD